MSAIVVRFSRSRRRQREVQRRAEHDVEFQDAFARAITELFPGCPPERAETIARHAGARRSGRLGRSAAVRALDPDTVTLAVVASVCHLDTPYDRLLISGVSRADARGQVADEVKAVVDSWRFAVVR